MRFNNGLTLFTRTSDRRRWNVAAFHSPHSLTWSWILSFSAPRADEGRWLNFWRYRDNNGLQWGLQVARHCLRWHKQRPLLYRDLWRKARDENEELRHLTRVATPELPPRSPFNPVIIDGGGSVH